MQVDSTKAVEGAERLTGNSPPRALLGVCHERGRESQLLSPQQISISTSGGAEGDPAGSLSPFTFFLGSGGGLAASFGGLAMQLVCSSLIAMIVEEWTMVRWGVRPRCRQLRMYCKERRESAQVEQPSRQEKTGKSGLAEAETGGRSKERTLQLLLYKPATHVARTENMKCLL